jgi:hypothetical protein
VVLTDLQGKGYERKEAFLLTAFLVTFVATYGAAILSTCKNKQQRKT